MVEMITYEFIGLFISYLLIFLIFAYDLTEGNNQQFFKLNLINNHFLDIFLGFIFLMSFDFTLAFGFPRKLDSQCIPLALNSQSSCL
jgi:hypothetical protein